MIGQKFGSYEVLAKLGEGGMGEVYRARDTKLDRDVAVKVLPESFALDGDRVARFTREAKTLASLNHPHIAAIYAVETTPTTGATALIMELVEGDDLSAVIARGALPLSDALPIAIQIAAALEAAHEQTIVHRDLKPQNVKLRSDGTVKVLDFGLAKAMDPSGASGAAALNSPTMTARATQVGMIIGTAAYMSPEQAKGKVVDKRTDIWAFGVVLCEMLTGQRVFKGEDVSDTLASVLKDAPDFTALPAATPAAMKRLIARCLERDPKIRLRDIGEARVVLEELARGGAPADAAPAPTAPQPARVTGLMAAVALAMLAFGLGAGWWLWRDAGPAASGGAVSRIEVLAPAGVTAVPFTAIAPDGSFVVFTGRSGNSRQLYVRRLDDLTVHPLAGTDGGELPFVSADNQWIAFSRANRLEKIAVGGGDTMRIADLPLSTPGSSWCSDNAIVVTTSWNSGLSTVSASGGGQIQSVTTVDEARGERGHWYPQCLPDGRRVLFTILKAAGGVNDAEIAMLDLSTGKYQVIMKGAHGSYVAPGFLVFYRAGAYQAVRFDLPSLATSGDAVTVLSEDRHITPDGSNPTLFVASNGTAVYSPGQYHPTTSLAWVNEGGDVELLPFTERTHSSAALAPGGGRIAAGVLEGGRYVVRLLDLARRTDDIIEMPGINWSPVWNPGGTRIAVRSMVKGDFDVYAKEVATAVPPVLLLSTPRDESPMAWLSERTLAVSQADETGVYRTKQLDLDAPDKLASIADYNPDSMAISPDRRWLAIAGVPGGRSEIHVRRVEGDGVPERISSNGGSAPVWLSNGRELVYLRGEDIIVRSWREEAGLFTVEPERVWARFAPGALSDLFDAGTDGRVLAGMVKGEKTPPQVRVILNWQQELERRLGLRTSLP